MYLNSVLFIFCLIFLLLSDWTRLLFQIFHRHFELNFVILFGCFLNESHCAIRDGVLVAARGYNNMNSLINNCVDSRRV